METISVSTLKGVFLVVGAIFLVVSLVGAFRKKQDASEEGAFGDRFTGIMLGALFAFLMAPLCNIALDAMCYRVVDIFNGAQSVVSQETTPIDTTKPASLEGVTVVDGNTKIVLRTLAPKEEWVLSYEKPDGTRFNNFVPAGVYNAGEVMKDVKVYIEVDGVTATGNTPVPPAT